MKLLLFSIAFCIPFQALSHSGGTDENGCHAGSEPYHCHNDSEGSSAKIAGWDINVGYQYHIKESIFIPFIGASVGEFESDSDTNVGVNLGLKLQNQFYVAYASTSKSFQIGYSFIHLSANSDYLGFGLRFPFGNSSSENHSSFFASGSVLFGSDE